MHRAEQIPVSPATLVQCSQFYSSLGNSRSFSSTILDVPPSTSKTSLKSPIVPIEASQSLPSVLHMEASASPSTSAHDDHPLVPNNSAEPSSLEDALVEKFMDSIVISGNKSDKASETNGTDIEQGKHGHSGSLSSILMFLAENVHLKVLKLKKVTLAIRRGVPKPLDLNIPIPGPCEGPPNTADMNLELPGGLQDIPPITPLDQIIPNPVSPPPAPKPRQAPLLTIQGRRASTTCNGTRMVRAGLFASPITTGMPINATRRNPRTPILDMASFLTISKEPSRPLLSPFHLSPDRSYGVYRPMSSPMDTDFDLYGSLSTPMSWSPTKCVHAG